MKEIEHSIREETKCTHLKELIKAEMPGIINEIRKDQYYLGQKRRRPVSWKEAEQDYCKHYLKTWATGFKYCYCNYTCPARKSCKIKER